LSQMTAPQWKS